MKDGKRTISSGRRSRVRDDRHGSVDDDPHLVTNVPGVTAFHGLGSAPDALKETEIDRIIGRRRRTRAASRSRRSRFRIGEHVRVVDGPVQRASPGVVDETTRAWQVEGDGEHLRPRDACRARLSPGPAGVTVAGASGAGARGVRGRRLSGACDRRPPRIETMAEDDSRRMVKLQAPRGQRHPAPPVGPALGQHGVNIMEFCKQFNARTQHQAGLIIPAVITIYKDRSFHLHHQDAPASMLLKRAAGMAKGSGVPNRDEGGQGHPAQVTRDRRAEDARPQLRHRTEHASAW